MHIFFISVLWMLITPIAYTQSHTITSPDSKIKVVVAVENELSWSVMYNDKPVLINAEIGMDFSSGPNLAENPQIINHTIKSQTAEITSAIPYKDAIIPDNYTELTLYFKHNFQLAFRVYNDGVAYQITDNNDSKRNVLSEKIKLDFPENTTSLFPKEESMYSHNERTYSNLVLSDISAAEFCSLPVLFNTEHAKVLLTETALHDYPGMFLQGNANNTMHAIFPKYVLEAKPAAFSPDRNQKITKEADYIAQAAGSKTYPWRVFIISDDDRTFIESNLAFQLSKPSALKNTSWIKPGKVAWDWYNANNIFGVDFESGLKTDTYKYYLDFAAANNIEYVILDEGWTKSTTEILDYNPDIDVQELIRYGKAKGVELILWVLWKPLDEDMVRILETYKSWGVKGIKVDFMQRNDQYMVNSYERIAAECARLELIVDFHGAFKPSGLMRMYPNVVNFEGVKGSENNKWEKSVTPTHNVTIPFIRMAAGPMDYTPGSMVNRQESNYAISFERPMSQGTRAHQVAMYVVYEAPLQMLCESPARYYKEQETVDFIVKIPTTWDETIVLHGAIGEYVAVARRKGDSWYLGAMTDWSSRNLELDLSFLEKGTYQMKVFKDGINANRFAEDYKIEVLDVNPTTVISAKLAKGGGWTAIISKQEF